MMQLTSKQAKAILCQAKDAIKETERRTYADYSKAETLVRSKCVHNETLTLGDDSSSPGLVFCRGCFADIKVQA